MSEKKTIGDATIELVVAVRNALDDWLNFVGTTEAASQPIESAKGKDLPVPKFNAEDYNSLPWESFKTRKNQTWERFYTTAMGETTMRDFGDKTPIIKDLINCCSNPEATISAPMLAYDYGYWLFKNAIYRREMKKP